MSFDLIMILKKKTLHFAQLMRVDKPVGNLLLLWPTMWALWLAHKGAPEYSLVFIFVTGTIGMRSFGCVVNDMCDLEFDKKVQRTQKRPLASGAVSMLSAEVVAVLLACFCLYTLWKLPQSVWPLGALGGVLTCAYPLAKRWLKIPQLFLGITFGLGVPIAYASSGHFIDSTGWLLYLGVVCWIVGFDSLYALQDKQDDEALALYSAAKTLKEWVYAFVALCYAMFVLALVGVGVLQGYTSSYYACVLGVGVMLGAQIVACYVVSHDTLLLGKQAHYSFVSNTLLGALLWLVFIVQISRAY